MSLVLSESLVLAKTRCQDLKSVLKLNCWGSGIKDVSLVRQLVNVEVIGLSCNEITTLEDFTYCIKLKELILRKNKISNLAEVEHLTGLSKLTCLWLGENPCAEDTPHYRKLVLKMLPNLTMLDNIPVSSDEVREAEEFTLRDCQDVPYESYNSSGSGPASTAASKPDYEGNEGPTSNHDINLAANTTSDHFSETNFYAPNEVSYDSSMLSSCSQPAPMNDSQYANQLPPPKITHNMSRSSLAHSQQNRSVSSQGSTTTLNGSQHQNWSIVTNNNILPKGGKSRNANILSAVLCLVKELDYVSCEVVQTALHCRMEETIQ